VDSSFLQKAIASFHALFNSLITKNSVRFDQLGVISRLKTRFPVGSSPARFQCQGYIASKSMATGAYEPPTNLPSWRRALLEKPPVVQIHENFPRFYGSRKIHYSVHKSLPLIPILYQINAVKTTPSYLRPILILFTGLCLGLPSCLFPSGFTTNILYAFLFAAFVLHVLPISSTLTSF
jgi:hypothetical protein